MSIFEECDDFLASFDQPPAIANSRAPITPPQNSMINSNAADILSDLDLSPESLIDSNYPANGMSNDTSNKDNSNSEYVDVNGGGDHHVVDSRNAPFDIDEILSDHSNSYYSAVKKENDQDLFGSSSLTSSASSNTLFSLNNENHNENAIIRPPQPCSSSSSITSSGTSSPQHLVLNSNNSKIVSTDKKVTKPQKSTKQKKQKSSHNMIEKRYRTNINNKIAILRDCVPSLRIVFSPDNSSSSNEDNNDDDDYSNVAPTGNNALDGLEPARKLNKATILAKATEYILHLQKRNDELMSQNKELQDKLKLSTDVIKREESELRLFNDNGFASSLNNQRSASLSSDATAFSDSANSDRLFDKLGDVDAVGVDRISA